MPYPNRPTTVNCVGTERTKSRLYEGPEKLSRPIANLLMSIGVMVTVAVLNTLIILTGKVAPSTHMARMHTRLVFKQLARVIFPRTNLDGHAIVGNRRQRLPRLVMVKSSLPRRQKMPRSA